MAEGIAERMVRAGKCLCRLKLYDIIVEMIPPYGTIPRQFVAVSIVEVGGSHFGSLQA